MRFSKAAALLSGILAGLALALVIASVRDVPTSEQDNAVELQVTTPPTETMSNSPAVPTGEPAFSGPPAGKSATIKLTAGNQQRQFIISVPRNFYPGRSIPVIFAFHGYRENAAVMQAYSRFDEAQALVIYPDGLNQSWEGAPYAVTNGGKDREFVQDILTALTTIYPVDKDRVFATGFSNGGGFAAMIGCQMPDLFAGVASVSAAYYSAVHENCSNTPVAMLDIHGTEDPTIAYEGGIRHNTRYDSVPTVLAQAAKRNHCQDQSSTYRINSSATRQDWHGCVLPLSHIRVGEGVHVWPGAPNDKREKVPQNMATDEVLRFFGIPKVPHH